ncbi:MAG: diacylglycerol/lipid kinase family protein, partial [Rhodospirillaceae bacterium]
KAFKYDFPPITVEVDGGPPQTGATVVVCKGAHYGGPFLGAPDADILDPSFQVVIMQRKGILNALRYGWGLVTGRFNKFPDVTIQKATHVRLSGPGALPLQGDGDTMAHLPVTISIAPEPVDVVMPV